MKNFFNLDFGSALKRIFGSEKKAESETVVGESSGAPGETEADSSVVLTI